MADTEWTKGEVKTAGFEHVEAKVYEHVQVSSGLTCGRPCTGFAPHDEDLDVCSGRRRSCYITWQSC